jgi:hypothetical protein
MKIEIGEFGRSRMIGISFNRAPSVKSWYYSISLYIWKYEIILLLKKININNK